MEKKQKNKEVDLRYLSCTDEYKNCNINSNVAVVKFKAGFSTP